MGPQDYSAFADLLNKFPTAALTIQALWLAAAVIVVAPSPAYQEPPASSAASGWNRAYASTT